MGITQDVLNQFIRAFDPTPEEIAAHPIELISIGNSEGGLKPSVPSFI